MHDSNTISLEVYGVLTSGQMRPFICDGRGRKLWEVNAVRSYLNYVSTGKFELYWEDLFRLTRSFILSRNYSVDMKLIAR
jgi:hypothetical protein